MMPLGVEQAAGEGLNTAPDEQGMLAGKVLIIPRHRDKTGKSSELSFIKEVKKKIKIRSEYSDDDLKHFLLRIENEIVELGLSIASLRFALFRTGEVRIWFEGSDVKDLSDDRKRVLSRQVYFFIKDIVHHHVHHDSKSDQITPLTEVGGLDPILGEELWRRDTLWHLSRAIDSLTRYGKLSTFRPALGIIAYADAFQKSLLPYIRDADSLSTFKASAPTYSYDYAHIKESLKVQIEQAMATKSSRAQFLFTGVTGGVAATSLLISYISAYNGALSSKSFGQSIVIPHPPSVINDSIVIFTVPIILIIFTFIALSWFFLSESRIGVQYKPKYKLKQAVRGLFNSIALKFGLGARFVHYGLKSYYLMLTAMPLCILYKEIVAGRTFSHKLHDIFVFIINKILAFH